jgi:HEPN domain-containing protein
VPGSRTTDVPRARSRVYLRRAEELLKAVDWGLSEGKSNVAAINAVQSGISAADAYVVFHLGIRSSATHHPEVVGLVARCPAETKAEVGRHLQRLLDRKNEVEYQDREIALADAKDLARHAHRLYDAVRAELAP